MKVWIGCLFESIFEWTYMPFTFFLYFCRVWIRHSTYFGTTTEKSSIMNESVEFRCRQIRVRASTSLVEVEWANYFGNLADRINRSTPCSWFPFSREGASVKGFYVLHRKAPSIRPLSQIRFNSFVSFILFYIYVH